MRLMLCRFNPKLQEAECRCHECFDGSACNVSTHCWSNYSDWEPATCAMLTCPPADTHEKAVLRNTRWMCRWGEEPRKGRPANATILSTCKASDNGTFGCPPPICPGALCSKCANPLFQV